jgi:hypothetical protein
MAWVKGQGQGHRYLLRGPHVPPWPPVTSFALARSWGQIPRFSQPPGMELLLRLLSAGGRPGNRVSKPQAGRMPGSGSFGKLTKVPVAEVLDQTSPPNLDNDLFCGLGSAHTANAPTDPDMHSSSRPLERGYGRTRLKGALHRCAHRESRPSRSSSLDPRREQEPISPRSLALRSLGLPGRLPPVAQWSSGAGSRQECLHRAVGKCRS